MDVLKYMKSAEYIEREKKRKRKIRPEKDEIKLENHENGDEKSEK